MTYPSIPQEVTNTVTNVTAGAAVASPWWLPQLSEVSEGAAAVLPILGVVWLIVQIYSKLTENKKRHKNDL